MSHSDDMSASRHENFSTWLAGHNTDSPAWAEEQWKLARSLCASPIPSSPTAKHSNIYRAPEKIVHWDGVSINWFLDIFMNMPEAIQCAQFGCPLWFVRNNCIPLMLQNRGQKSGSFMDFLIANSTEYLQNQQENSTSAQYNTQGPASTGTSTVFISYTGSYSLRHFSNLVSRIGNSESTPSGGHYLWIDLFCVDQFAWNERKDEEMAAFKDQFSNELRQQVNNIGHTALFLHRWSDLEALRMIWVVWEIFSTVDPSTPRSGKLEVVFNEEEQLRFHDEALTKKEGFLRLRNALSDIDSDNATARNKGDRDRIIKEIGKTGRSEVNSTVIKCMRNWLAETGMDMLKRHRENENPELWNVMNNICGLLSHLSMYKESVELQREELEFRGMELTKLKEELKHEATTRTGVDENHSDEENKKRIWDLERSYLSSKSSLAAFLVNLQELEEADVLSRDSLEDLRKMQPIPRGENIIAMNTRSTVLRQRGKVDEAESLRREIIADFDEDIESLDSIERFTLINCKLHLANVLYTKYELEEAEMLYRSVLEAWEKEFNSMHSHVLLTKANLGSLLHDTDRLEEAEKYQREALEGQLQRLGDSDGHTIRTMFNVSNLLLEQDKDLDEAERLCVRALNGYMKLYGPSHQDTIDAGTLLKQINERKGNGT